jgi:hypothetical protein
LLFWADHSVLSIVWAENLLGMRCYTRSVQDVHDAGQILWNTAIVENVEDV